MVLPAPGGPSSDRWCPPAAQISAALRATGWPSTSDRSGRRGGGLDSLAGSGAGAFPADPGDPASAPSCGGPDGCPAAKQATSPAPASCSPRSHASRAARVGAPTTLSPGTRAASAAFARATTTLSKPAPAAAAIAGRTPRTGRSRPSSPSSPRNATSSIAAAGTAPAAARIDNAIPMSKPLPRLGRLAGDSPTVIRRCGHCSRLLMIAARIRSRASLSAVSGSPMRSRHGSPFAISLSISTG